MENIIMYVLAFAATFHLCAASSSSPPAALKLDRNTTVKNNDELPSFRLTDGSVARFILLKRVKSNHFLRYGQAIGFCFHYLHHSNHSFGLSVIVLDIINNTFAGTYQELWSAGPGITVEENGTLEPASNGNLVLKNSKGRIVWRTDGTYGEVLSCLDITVNGNVRLFSQAQIVWQSFNYPTDTLLVGQNLTLGKNLTTRNGLFNVKIRLNQTRAYAQGRRQVNYFAFAPDKIPERLFHTAQLVNVQFLLGRLSFLYNTSEGQGEYAFQIPVTVSQFFRIDPDGGLRVYGWEPNRGWRIIFVFGGDECAFTLKCGRYGVCQGGQCTCPLASDGGEYFRPVDPRQPNLGCELSDVSQNLDRTSSELMHFMDLSYFTNYCDDVTAIPSIDNEEGCKQACRAISTCKAALFRPFGDNAAKGTCFLISKIWTIIGKSMEKTSTKMGADQLYLRIPTTEAHRAQKKKRLSTIASLLIILAAVLGVSSSILLAMKLKLVRRLLSSELQIEGFSETPLRFSYKHLRVATKNFSKPIGEGGFGVVYEGVLENRTTVAVKRLKKVGQGMEEFLAEMETLGTIHHISLVSLIGFCADRKGNRMLVYEYMTGGSLDKWIFSHKTDSCLTWNKKKKILFDVAKGLAYLHHECTHKIAHLDVKPQNILLDENFNAKLSDFGTSKLIDRNDSEVLIQMRGTLGYLAPEWQDEKITVRADTYSFGVVVLEVITGRKILDYSQQLECHVHLLCLLQTKAAENRLMDVVDCYCGNFALQSDREEALALIQLGMWCLNINYTKRPSMFLVMKFLEGITTSYPQNLNLPVDILSPSNVLNCFSSDIQLW